VIPTPITKALFSMKANGVRSLMMGGQACVLYGAAEFSRDLDLVIQVDENNLLNLERALKACRSLPGAYRKAERRASRSGGAS
jgi:hypothetical protein